VLGGRTGGKLPRRLHEDHAQQGSSQRPSTGRTIAAKAGTSAGALDPLKILKANTPPAKAAEAPQQPETDNAALAAAADDAAAQSTEEPGDEDAAENATANPGQPKVLEAELSGDIAAASFGAGRTTPAPEKPSLPGEEGRHAG
jgi:hypothetical protein